jgi:hypothetical protein
LIPPEVCVVDRPSLGAILTPTRVRGEYYSYPMHAHDTYPFGVTDDGAQSFVCRGERHISGGAHPRPIRRDPAGTRTASLTVIPTAAGSIVPFG